MSLHRTLSNLATAVALSALSVVPAAATPPAGAASGAARDASSSLAIAAAIDIDRSDAPVPSVEVLKQRFVILGAEPEAAAKAVAALSSASRAGDGASAAAQAAVASLQLHDSAKAAALAEAFLRGESVSLAGLERSPRFAARMEELQARGADADSAAWQASADLPRVESAASADDVAQPSAHDSRSGRLRRFDGLGGTDGSLPIVIEPRGVCRTCPSIDVMLGEPTTSWQTHASSLTEGSCKMYRFLAVGGRTYRFSFCDGGGTATFDTLLDSYNTQCTPSGSNDDFCTTRSKLDVTAPANGYVFLKVSGKGGAAGSYTLAYERLPAGTAGCPTCPAYDAGSFTQTTTYQTTTVTVPASGCRILRFSALVNRTYRFTACEGGGSNGFDTVFEVYNGGCRLVASNDDACISNGSQVDVASNTSQYLYLKVYGFAGAGGTVTVAYRDNTNNCPTCPSFNFGSFGPPHDGSYAVHSSTIDATGGCKIYKFVTCPGSPYRFTLCPGDDPRAGASFDSFMQVLDASCAVIASNDNACGTSSRVTTTATTSVTYVRITSVSGTGAYTLAYAGQPQATTSAFAYTGGVQTYTVPCDVVSVYVEAYGAAGLSGGSIAPGSGGYGGYAAGRRPVQPGEVLYLYVGGQGTQFNGGGAGGANGGGAGGDATDVRAGGQAPSNRILIAGGGGGGGSTGCYYGGALSGGNGGDAHGFSGGNGASTVGAGGQGGSPGAGGAGGDGCVDGSPGGVPGGGAGVNAFCFTGGGGGGGGLVAGGGGGGGGFLDNATCSVSENAAGGGGAGGTSSLSGVSQGTTFDAANSGSGAVYITY